MTRRATIEDVAKAAGVSVATVSRALRDLPNVAPSTKAKVQRVAGELDYVVNPTASRLAFSRGRPEPTEPWRARGAMARSVAVAVPVFDSWYFSKLVAGLEAVVREAGIELLLHAISNEEERCRFLAGRGSWRPRCDGLVMADLRLYDAEADRLAGQGARIVTIGAKTPFFSSIVLDERVAAGEAMKHLVEQGHRRIGFIVGESHALDFRVPMQRLDGAKAVMQAAGITPDPSLEVSGGFNVAGGREAMAKMLDLADPPTAVFALSDDMAYGAIDAVRRCGRRVPEDVAVVGFDDNDMAELFGLTTVRQDVDQIGATAGRMLVQSLDDRHGGGHIEHICTPTYLVIRSSSMQGEPRG
ncbi:MAG: LacI family DNA-binding transcriptional regulator [Acidimicrobiales bacterium]